MAKLYVVTGPAGVGKSTISKGIANSLDKSVLLEGDDFYHQVVGGYVQAWKEGNHLDIFWKVCVDVIRDYIEAGYDVIFNYIINKDTFDKLKNEFKDIDMKFVVLLVNEETIMARDKERDEDCQMKERCIILLNKFKNYDFDENYIIYTDNITIEETTKEILDNDRFIVKEN